jgi:K(+)-stimulated pyrophosphate-energized sodium pump
MSLGAEPGMGWFEMTPTTTVGIALIGGVVSLLTAIMFAMEINNTPVDHTKTQTLRIARLISEGAKAFLHREYRALLVFVLGVGIPMGIFIHQMTMMCFFVGAFLSALSGYCGMLIAVKSNVLTTFASQGEHGLNNGLKVAFKSGAVMALGVCASGLLGVPALYLLLNNPEEDPTIVWERIAGFAFGGSSIALFARVGGGIYTKAADVGADLVGKVENGLEEDSVDNPATIADNVGDNVGDVAGMGADLFESYVGSIIAAATLGVPRYGQAGVALPFWVAGTGALCSIAGTFLIKANKRSGASKTEVLESLLHAIRVVIYASSIMVCGATLACIGATFGFEHKLAWPLFFCVLIGLVVGNLIGYTTEYATSYTEYPTQSIAQKSDTGPATVIIQGLGVGMLSTVPSVIFIFGAIVGTYALAGIYGIAICAVGMLSTLGVTLATDAFGPVADNAGGIAEMAPNEEIAEDTRETTDNLDALGNTTAATGKGFAIGSAVLTALALMTAFAEATFIDVEGVNLLDEVVLGGILLGALQPYVFGALTMLSVGKAAESIMWECRDQLNKKHFQQLPIDSSKCIDICTQASLQEMVFPGMVSVFLPVIVGTMLGARGLLGMLTGAIASGFLLAVMMSNAGGAWDNAKKFVEKNGLMGGRSVPKSDPSYKGKGSKNHAAVVVGDTVGDPFKDTSGPSLNILIKLMTIVALVIAPALTDVVGHDEVGNEIREAKPKWSEWWVSCAVMVVLLVLGFAWNWYINKFGQLHDKAKIDRESHARKRETGESDLIESEPRGIPDQDGFAINSSKPRAAEKAPLVSSRTYGSY